MASIPNRTTPIAGAKYRESTWHTMVRGTPRLLGYGLEERQLGQRRYALVAWNGQAYPFETLAEARNKAKQLNEQASTAAAHLHPDDTLRP